MLSITQIIDSIVNRISLPLSDEDRWSRSAVVATIGEVVQEQVTPKLIQEGGEYLVHRLVVPLQVSGLPVYPNLRIPLPRRIYGRALREIKYLYDRGDGSFEVQDEVNVTWCSVAEADSYEHRGFNTSNPMVCIVNDHVRLLGNPESATGALVFYYHLEVSDIVDKTTEFANITNIAYSAGTTTFTATAGAEYTTYQAVAQTKFVDIYRQSSGAILRPDVKLTRTASTTWTTTDLTEKEANELKAFQYGGYPVVAPYDSEVYLVPAGQCQFSTIPEAFDSILVLETCSRILESLGDVQGLEVVGRMLEKAYNSISVSMGNRLSGQQKRVTDNRSIANYQRINNFANRLNGRNRL